MAPRGINIKCVRSMWNFMLFRGRKSFRQWLNHWNSIQMYIFVFVFSPAWFGKAFKRIACSAKIKFKRKPLAIRSKCEWTLRKSAPGLKEHKMKNGKENRLKPVAATAAKTTSARCFEQIVFAVSVLSSRLLFSIIAVRCVCALNLSAQSHFDSILFYFTFLICCSKSMFSEANNHTSTHKHRFNSEIQRAEIK